MSKKKKKKKKRPNIPLSAMLHVRMEELFSQLEAQEGHFDALADMLNKTAEGLKPADFFAMLLARFKKSTPAIQEGFAEHVADWLQSSQMAGPLHRLLEEQKLQQEHEATICEWLSAAGVSLTEYEERKSIPTFFKAFQLVNEMQGAVIGLFYTDHRRIRVRAMTLLLDFQPPWEGSVKDIMMKGPFSESDAVKQMVDHWVNRGIPPEEIDGATFKKVFFDALQSNKKEGIALPKDLTRQRDFFFRHIPILPDTPETGSFTEVDFDMLSKLTRTPEQLAEHEELFGYDTRLPGGEEVILHRFDD